MRSLDDCSLWSSDTKATSRCARSSSSSYSTRCRWWLHPSWISISSSNCSFSFELLRPFIQDRFSSSNCSLFSTRLTVVPVPRRRATPPVCRWWFHPSWISILSSFQALDLDLELVSGKLRCSARKSICSARLTWLLPSECRYALGASWPQFRHPRSSHLLHLTKNAHSLRL